MYLDTLKVSTVEQTAEQSSARGGLGNPELIMWDYGKEITVTLEDALYSPASQSLMWGGKFGTKNSKIYGVWNPMVYPKDRYGRSKYITQEIAVARVYNNEQADNGVFYPVDFNNYYDKNTLYPVSHSFGINHMYIVYNGNGERITGIFSTDEGREDQPSYPIDNSDDIAYLNPRVITKENGWVPFICPCDNKLKYMRYVANINGEYKYHRDGKDDFTIDQLDGSSLLCPKNYPIKENNEILMGYYANEVINAENWGNTGRPELAELIIDTFGKFSVEKYDYSPTEVDGEIICISTVSQDVTLTSSCGVALGYIWSDTDLKMVSLEGNQDQYYTENASVKFRTPADSTNKLVMISQRKLYETSYNTDNDEWTTTGSQEITTTSDLSTRYNTPGLSYGYKLDKYSSKVDFYITIPWAVPGITEEEHLAKIKVGTFYIVADWNYSNEPPQNLIWPINNGLENVPFLERMEKCKASQTFCIDADRNLVMGNYRYMQEYNQASLTVYIDPKTMKPYEPNSDSFTRRNGCVVHGNLRIIKQHEIYYKWTRTRAPEYTTLGHRIIVDATHFPGTYRLVGETYARSRVTGKDQRYQFEIPLAKMSADNNLTLQADGDPTTFTMTLKALRREDGVMMKLTQYEVDCQSYGDTTSGSMQVIPTNSVEDPDVINVYNYDETSQFILTDPVDGVIYSVNEAENTQDVQTSAILKTIGNTVISTFDKSNLVSLGDTKLTKTSDENLIAGKDYTIEVQEGE